jgi:hypothetical protein
MLRCPLVVKTASAGFSPIGGQPPKWPPSGHLSQNFEKTPQFITYDFFKTLVTFLPASTRSVPLGIQFALLLLLLLLLGRIPGDFNQN